MLSRWYSGGATSLHCQPARQQGFSLLEVLVAFAVLSLALGVLLQVFSAGLRNAAISEEYTYAVLHAESLLAALGRQEPLSEGVQQGELDEKFSWRMTVTPYMEEDKEEESSDLSDSAVVPYQVEVEVFWQSSNRTRSVILETLRLNARESI